MCCSCPRILFLYCMLVSHAMILPACGFQYSLDWHLPSAHYPRLHYFATASVTDAHFCGGTVARKFCTNIHSTEACHLQALEAAPLLATTCLQTRLKPRAMIDATCCALLDLSSFFTLSVYTNFPGTTRRARRSAISRARISFLTHAQNFSTGFRSGDLAGIVHSFSLCCL